MKKKASQKKAYQGHSKEIADILAFEFEGLPCVDATEQLRLFPTTNDVKVSKPKDPTNCTLAVCAKRTTGENCKVRFWRTVAYIELPDRNGNRRVERFAVTPEARKIVEALDRGKKVPVGTCITLKPLKPSMQMAVRATPEVKAKIKQYHETLREKIRNGEVVKSQKVKIPIALQDVRSGTGAVRITRTSKKK